MRKALLVLTIAATAFAADSRPKVRAVTAFIRIDAANYEAQYTDTMRFLNSAADAYRAAGFEVDGVRIATQPFPEYIRGMKPDEALRFLQKIDELAKRLKFRPSIGTAMIHDDDDAGVLDVLAKALSTTGLNASVVIAGDDGIHWRAIRESAKLIRNIARQSPHGRGNLNFAASAMVKPYCPFYPAAWHTGAGRTFAVGLEGANVVTDVFARTHDPREAEKQLAAALGRYMKEAEAVATQLAAKGGLDLRGHRSDAGAGRRRLDRARDRELHRGAIRVERDDDGGEHHHARGEGRAGEADGVLRADGPGARGQRAGEALGGGHVQHRFAAGVLGGVRRRTRHGPVARGCHGGPDRENSRRCRIARV